MILFAFSSSLSHTFDTLLGASFRLVLIGGLIALCLRLLGTRAPAHHRWLWAATLVQSLILVPVLFDLPVLEPNSQASHAPVPVTQVGLASESSTVAPAEDPTVPRPLSITTVLLALWLFGLGCLWSLLAFAQLLVWSHLRRTPPAREDWAEELQEVKDALGITTPVRLAVHASMGPMLGWCPRLANLVPSTIRAWLGLAKVPSYCIIVPRENWENLSEYQRRAVLIHELAHLQRRDLWKSLVMRAVAAFHWFNPVAWWAVRKFDEAAEWACDGRVRQTGEDHATALASALLLFSKPAPLMRLGVSSARGARVGVRVRRLLGEKLPRETAMKRLVLLGLVLLIFGVAAVRIRLVAQESPPSGTAGRELVANVIAQLDAKDPTTAKLVQVLETPAGALLLQDELSSRASDRSESQDLVSVVLNQHFDLEASPPVLREGSSEFGRALIQAAQRSKNTASAVEKACLLIAQRLEGQDEVTLLIKRFLESEHGPKFLYIKVLAEYMQPSPAMFGNSIGRSLVRDDQDGLYYIRQTAREQLQSTIGQLDVALEELPKMQGALEDWAAELEEGVNLHQRIQKASGSPEFSAMILAKQMFERKKIPPRMAVALLDQLDQAVIDTSRGLSIREEAQDQITALLDDFDTALGRLDATEAALDALAEKIAEPDELHATFKKLLGSKVGAVAVALSGKTTVGMDPQQLILEAIGEAFESKTLEGPLHLSSDPEIQAEVQQQIQEAFREMRMAKRHARPVRELAESLQDSTLATALESMGGLLVIRERVEQWHFQAERQALEDWKQEVFQEQDGLLVVRPGLQSKVQEFVNRATSLAEEMANDDF